MLAVVRVSITFFKAHQLVAFPPILPRVISFRTSRNSSHFRALDGTAVHARHLSSTLIDILGDNDIKLLVKSFDAFFQRAE